MSLLSFNHVTKYFGAERVLDDVSFRVDRGDRIGLVGVNGAGKSTILRIIMGLEEPDVGTVARAQGLRVTYLPQEPEFEGHETLFDAVLSAFRDAIRAQERLRELEARLQAGEDGDDLMEEYGRLQATVEHAGYDYRQQVERVLTGLALPESLWNQPVDNLSGGQRTRANLARTLLQEADLLLLDEPTNHLDIAAVEWLESYLRDLKRSFIIVAHDRYLLDHVTNRTLELSFGHATAYDAPYSRYLELRAERAERQRQEYEAQQEHIVRTEEFVRRYGAGQRSKEARGRQKRLDRLERVERPQDEEQVHLRLDRARRSGDIVLSLERLVAGYPDNPLVRLPDEVVVRRGERIAIIGPNGAGKTTLLRTLIGALDDLEGTVHWGSNTSVGYYSQTLGQLDESHTVLEEIQSVKPMDEAEARNYLGRFLFRGDDVFKRISVLSGGERSRVALAKLILEAPNVLVLDEPTNHLDIASREALQSVLQNFGGTILFVSHDRYLIDSLAQQLWVVQDGTLLRYEGNYSALSGGSATPLDRVRPKIQEPGLEGLSPAERLQRLEAESDAVAARLAEESRTLPAGQLRSLIDRYSGLQAALEEAQEAWLHSLTAPLRASSG